MFTRFAALARSSLQAKEGVVAIQMALMMPLLIGMSALAIDVGFVLDKQRQMQSAADAAAFSAAIAKKTGYPAAFSTEAYAVAGKVGFVNGANGVTVTVNNPPVNPPATATDAANNSAIQVIVQQHQTLPLVRAVCSLIPGATCSGTFNVGASAVATAPSGATSCALQLSSTANPGVTIDNGATVNLTSCGLQACSTGGQALTVNGGAQLNVPTTLGVSVGGAATINNGGAINGTQNTCSGTCAQSQGTCKPGLDPYNGVVMPTMSPGNCDQNGKNFCSGYGCTSNMVPGHYCNGPNFLYGNVTMSPGIYYIDGGQGQGGSFNVASGVSLSCPTCTGSLGVTIVLTGSGASYATVNIGGGATVTLNAPTSGTTSGIVFFGDRNAPLTNNNIFQGGSNLNITGAYYFPSQEVTFNNGSSSNSSGCTQLVGGQLNFQGGTNFSNTSCAGTGTTSIGGGITALVE